jgi:hypothetical protein
LAHPFADFLPSFWAKGIFGHSSFCFRVSVFFSGADSPVGAAADGGLIFINTVGSTRGYGAIMAPWYRS